VVLQAIALADEAGLDALTVRRLAEAVGMSPMSVYTHVNSRDDLVVLMTDVAHASMSLPVFRRRDWRTRMRQVAQANLRLFRSHPWLLDCTDPRTALGPGTIAKYDHELHALDHTGLTDVERDAALTFVLDFTRASARAQLATAAGQDFGPTWEAWAGRLGQLMGEDFALAQRVGRSAGEELGGPYHAEAAWNFGIARVLAGLADLIED
jgi:AcrR family transcriptional regulator